MSRRGKQVDMQSGFFMLALSLWNWLIPMFKTFMPHSASSCSLQPGALLPPFFSLPCIAPWSPYLWWKRPFRPHSTGDINTAEVSIIQYPLSPPLYCTGNSGILSVWYVSAALVIYKLPPGPRVWLKAWKRGRNRNPCQCSSSEGVVNAPDSLKLISQEELETAQTDLSLCSLRKHRSTP